MNPLDKFIGERVKISERRYEISGFNIADREVRIRVVPLDPGRERVVEVSFPQALKGLFHDCDPQIREVHDRGRTKRV
jgi:hypothetical protein